MIGSPFLLRKVLQTDISDLKLLNFAVDLTCRNYNAPRLVMQAIGGKFLCSELIRTTRTGKLACFWAFRLASTGHPP